MVNYWSFSGDFNDSVGGQNLYGGVNVQFTTDRNGKTNNAIKLQFGYLKAPVGVYFSGAFSITSWVNIQSSASWMRIVDFSTQNENIYLSASSNGASRLPTIAINDGITSFGITSSQSLTNNKWMHVSAIGDCEYMRLYIDGKLTGETKILFLPSNNLKNKSFVGRSRGYPKDQDANLYLDELKFYNRALSIAEIQNDMKSLN